MIVTAYIGFLGSTYRVTRMEAYVNTRSQAGFIYRFHPRNGQMFVDFGELYWNDKREEDVRETQRLPLSNTCDFYVLNGTSFLRVSLPDFERGLDPTSGLATRRFILSFDEQGLVKEVRETLLSE